MKETLFTVCLLFTQSLMATGVNYTSTPIHIDGVSESAWNNATWHPMPYLMDGSLPSSEADFNGRYRLLWDENFLYLQAAGKY